MITRFLRFTYHITHIHIVCLVCRLLDSIQNRKYVNSVAILIFQFIWNGSSVIIVFYIFGHSVDVASWHNNKIKEKYSETGVHFNVIIKWSLLIKSGCLNCFKLLVNGAVFFLATDVFFYHFSLIRISQRILFFSNGNVANFGCYMVANRQLKTNISFNCVWYFQWLPYGLRWFLIDLPSSIMHLAFKRWLLNTNAHTCTMYYNLENIIIIIIINF